MWKQSERSRGLDESPRPSFISPQLLGVLALSSACAWQMGELLQRETPLQKHQPVKAAEVAYRTFGNDTQQLNIHSGPFQIEGIEGNVFFLDDGFTLLLENKMFRLSTLSVMGNKYDVEMIKSFLGEEGITQIEYAGKLTFQSGKNSLSIPGEDFRSIVEKLDKADEMQHEVPCRNIPYELSLNGALQYLVAKEGFCTINFNQHNPESHPAIASLSR